MKASLTREFAEAVAAALSAKTGETFVALPGLALGPDFRPINRPAKPDLGEPSDAEVAEGRGLWILCGNGVGVEIAPSREYSQRGRIAYGTELPRSPEGWHRYVSELLDYNEARSDNGTVSGDCAPARLASAIAKVLPTCRHYTGLALKSYQDQRERENSEETAGRRLARAAGFLPAEEERAVDRSAPNYRAKLSLFNVLPGDTYGEADFSGGCINMELRRVPLEKAEAVLRILAAD